MTDIILEAIRALVLLGIVLFLWNAGRGQFKQSRQGWRFIVGGFGLLLFGSVLDISDNFDSLNKFVIVGDTEVEAFLEKFVGFLGGFFFLAIGLIRWIPRVQNLSDLVEDRTIRLQETNESLVAEVAQRKRSETLQRGKNQALELLATNGSLEEVLTQLIVTAEEISPSMLGSVLLLNKGGKHLLHGAAPSLPDFYNEAIHGLEIGYGLGSCGTAAETGQPVIVKDIKTHPYWVDYQSLAAKADLKACWSQPILSSDAKVLGTFAMYYQESREPTQEELEIMQEMGSLASIAIEKKRSEKVKREFLSTVSHELRTPLTSIKGSLSLIKSGVSGQLPDEFQSMLDIASTNSERLVALINDILDIEKFEDNKMNFQMKPMEVASLIEEAIEANKGYGEKYGVNFVKSDMEEGAMVDGDKGRLMQALSNLMSNAAKYSPAGEQVELSVTRHEKDIRISVKDNGSGIPEEFRSSIFEKFTQLDSTDARQIGGTGLGLSIAKAIVEYHGGIVGYTSEVGVGSTFYFTLPVLE